MSVTAANKLSGTRGNALHEYTDIWQVFTDSVLDGPNEVLAYNGLPQLLDIHDTDSLSAVSNDRRADQEVDNPRIWKVTIEYKSLESLQFENNTRDISALDYTPKITWEVEGVMRPVELAYYVDEDGVEAETPGPVVNLPLNDKFDPPVEEEEFHLIMVYRRNEAAYNPLTALQYFNAINEDQFLFAEPNQAKCLSIVASDEMYDAEFDIKYREVIYRIAFAETWVRSLLNQGFRAMDDNGEIYTFDDGQARNLSVEDGTVLSEGADPQYVKYRTKKKLAFSSLNLTFDTITTIVSS